MHTANRLTTALQGRYTIRRELGSGGMATVYVAHDVRHDREVAVKVLHPDLGAVLGGERFLSEIKTTARLQHPHILPLLDSGEADGLLFYVMPLVEGQTLRAKLERERQLSIDEALRIATEVAGALDYAHRHNVIHRDIKPENILLHDGRAVVADFGIALAVTAASGTRMTQTGLSLGTPQYMAPEQAMGEKVIDARADVYALGAVTYEMLTGEPPFSGATVQAIVAKVLTEKPMSPTAVRDTVPRHVEATVTKALAKLPADRFATAAQFADALAQPQLTAGITRATLAGAPQVATRGVRRLVSASPGVWALLAASAVAAVWGWTRSTSMPFAPVTKVQLGTGRGFTLSSTPQLAISNDGSRVAFIGQDSALVRHLMVRSLDGLDAVVIAGTRNAAFPFFSPDGESIGFFQDGKLRTMSLRGGAVSNVCDCPAGIATWGDDGSIAFASGGSLMRVLATGGVPDTVVAHADGRVIARPSFLPGSRALLAEDAGDSPGIVIIRLDDASVTRLSDGFYPQYVEAGFLVFGTREGSLLAAPFDARKLRITGAAEPLTDQVLVAGPTVSKFGVSRSGTVAYLGGNVALGRELLIVERSGATRVLPTGLRMYRFPRFSPNGQQLAFHVEIRGSVNGDLWRYTFDGGSLLRLTSDSISGQPEWHPDGTKLVFIRNLRGSSPLELFSIAADGSERQPRPLLKRPVNIFESHITPDGRSIVFREDAGPTNRDILMAPLDSPAVVRPLAATPFDEKGLAMSPDGKWLAYVSNETGENEVYIRKIQEVSSRWPVSLNGGGEPRWARSGEIFFRRGDSVFVSRVELGAEPRLSAPRGLHAGNYASTGYEPLWDVSPDGQRFVFVRHPGGSGAPITLLMNWAQHWKARQKQ